MCDGSKWSSEWCRWVRERRFGALSGASGCMGNGEVGVGDRRVGCLKGRGGTWRLRDLLIERGWK